MSAEPNNITIELVHGGSVHVQHTMEEIGLKIWDSKNVVPSRFIKLDRVVAFDSRQARGFPQIQIDPNHIVAMYPLTSRSDPPRQPHD